MEVYLLRHAIAVPRGTPGYPNDDRPLTEDGIKKMRIAARGISKNISRIDLIIASPLQRAHNTAKIVSQELNYTSEIKISKHLRPGSNPNDLLKEIVKIKAIESVMLVGHNPDLGGIAGILLSSSPSTIEFKKGGICRVDIHALPLARPGKLIWHLTPKQLRAMA